MNNNEQLNSFNDKLIRYNIQVEISFDRKRLQAHDELWSHPKVDRKIFIAAVKQAIDIYQNQILNDYGDATILEERDTFIAAYMNYKVK